MPAFLKTLEGLAKVSVLLRLISSFCLKVKAKAVWRDFWFPWAVSLGYSRGKCWQLLYQACLNVELYFKVDKFLLRLIQFLLRTGIKLFCLSCFWKYPCARRPRKESKLLLSPNSQLFQFLIMDISLGAVEFFFVCALFYEVLFKQNHKGLSSTSRMEASSNFTLVKEM